MLFQYQPGGAGEGRQLPILSYWVAGRLFLAPHPRECYVCYHDSAPQVRLKIYVLIEIFFVARRSNSFIHSGSLYQVLQVMVELAFRLAFGVHM